MPDVLLTDIDGTLVDSNALHAEAWRRAFEQFGIQVGFDEAWKQIGKGGDKVVALFVPESDRERIEKPLKELRKEIFRRTYMDRMVAFPQADKLLVRARKAGLKIAIATSADKDDLPVYGKLVGMEDLVDEASSGGDTQHSKPDPDIFAVALEKVKMRPEQAIALGDTPWDAEAAGKLGIPIIGLTSGGWKANDLRAAGCVEVWKDPADLLSHFEDSRLNH